MKRCRLCRKPDGELVFQPADPDYRPGRRGYRAIGFGPSYHHAACLELLEAELEASRARSDEEFAAIIAEARAQLEAARA